MVHGAVLVSHNISLYTLRTILPEILNHSSLGLQIAEQVKLKSLMIHQVQFTSSVKMCLHGLAENIFLLERITKMPENGHNNPIAAQFHRCQLTERSLTLEQEQSVVSALSFLSSYTDDANKVSALCIEEDPGSSSLIVSTATNSGQMEKLKDGLEGITVLLMNEARDGMLPVIMTLESLTDSVSLPRLKPAVATTPRDYFTELSTSTGSDCYVDCGLDMLRQKQEPSSPSSTV